MTGNYRLRPDLAFATNDRLISVGDAATFTSGTRRWANSSAPFVLRPATPRTLGPLARRPALALRLDDGQVELLDISPR